MVNSPVRNTRYFFQRLIPRRRFIALLFFTAVLGSIASLADPGDFQAMPGLWKFVTTIMDHGHAGAPKTVWRCVDEGADPWVEFATIEIPGHAQCVRGNQHRRSTALDWTLSCPGDPSAIGKGRVDFDSAEHYTASVSMRDLGEVVRVEGKRYAACTSPSD